MKRCKKCTYFIDVAIKYKIKKVTQDTLHSESESLYSFRCVPWHDLTNFCPPSIPIWTFALLNW